MEPDAVDAAAAVAVGMERVEADALLDDDPLSGRRERIPSKGWPDQSPEAERGTVLKKTPAT
jgi:hypothetical protein